MDQKNTVMILDPSDKFRPEKKEEEFRNYTEDNEYHARVKKTYYDMHSHQTYEFVEGKMKQWCTFGHTKMSVMEALSLLDSLVDESDPDVDIPNSVHAFQTAERIREVHPEEPWFHLTGLIHDLGKVMAMWGEPQWSTVGDTFPVGCSFSDQCVFGKDSFEFNADTKKDEYNTRLGVYSENCGLSNVMMSWGHDEYMYRVLKNHPTCTLPEEAFYMIRFHSFYPWHTQKDYMYLCDNKDTEMLKWVLEFNKFDLYSKGDSLPDTAALTPYYQSLVDEFLPGDIKF